MSSSFVALGDRGFEANDVALEVWMAVLADEIGGNADAPDWLLELGTEWEWRCTAHLGSGLDFQLDTYAEEPEHRATLVEIARAAIQTMTGWGDPVSRDLLNGLRSWGPGYGFVADVPAEVLMRPGRYFLKLLDGSLGPDETDARPAVA